MAPNQFPEEFWDRMKETFGGLIDAKFEAIERHLRYTDGRVDKLELWQNGDANNLESHPGAATQLNELVKKNRKIGGLGWTALTALVGGMFGGIGGYFAHAATVKDVVEKVKP